MHVRNKLIAFTVNDRGCFVCTSHLKDRDGYARLVINGVKTSVHRYIYSQVFERVPTNLVVMHSCDNPACFNPAHLLMGTQRENMIDKARKNRSRYNGKRLSKREIAEIRANADCLKVMELATKYGVDYQTIKRYKNKSVVHQ
jgi:hypothetical protein